MSFEVSEKNDYFISIDGVLLSKEQLCEGYNSIGVTLNKGVYIFEFIFGDVKFVSKLGEL